MRTLLGIKQKLVEVFEAEHSEGRVALLIPILFGCGIGAYFLLHTEPDFHRTCFGLFACSLYFILCFFVRKKFILPSLALLIFALGFFAANLEARLKINPKVKPDLGVIWLRGNIYKLEKQEKFFRLFINNVDLWQPETGKFKPSETPKYIRLNVRTKVEDEKILNQNDYIQVKVILAPPPNIPAYPGGYDFGKYSYFEEIGAVGFAIADIKILKDNEENFITKIRNSINSKIEKAIEDKNHSSIAKALFTGASSEIDKDVNQTLRYSGLGHILSISGLHLSIVMLWVYLFIRIVCAAIPQIVLKYNSKKFGAVTAILFGFFYLMLADAPVPAVRSYIMLTIFFLAILLDREITPMRPVAVAALVILIIEPHALITPSFQMSFASIIGIAGCYEIYQKFRNFDEDFNKNENIFLKIIKYFGAIIATSIIAGIITSPFTSYHFNNIAKYGLFSNALAIPAISFITMPALAISGLLMPLGLETIPLKISEIGIEIMIKTADIFGGTDTVIWRIPQLPEYFLLPITLSWLFFFIFKTRINLLAIPAILICYLFILFPSTKPGVAVDSNGKFFAIKDGENYYYFGRSGGFKLKQYADKLAITKGLRLKPDDARFCKNENCYTKNIAIIRNISEINSDELCKNNRLVFNLTNEIINCESTKIISLNDLKTNGTYLGWSSGKTISVMDYSGKRIWNK